MSIRVSEKHGVNPSLDLCFWCGEAEGLVLFGKLRGDAEAPRQICRNYDPCTACQEKFGLGIVMVEVSPTPTHENQMEFSGAYPTGSHVVTKREWVERNVHPEELRNKILETGMCLMHIEEFNKVFSEYVGKTQ